MTINIEFLRANTTEMIFLMTHIMKNPLRDTGSSLREDYIGLSKRFYDFLTKESLTEDEIKSFNDDKAKVLATLFEIEDNACKSDDFEDTFHLELELEKRRYDRNLAFAYEREEWEEKHRGMPNETPKATLGW
jgi:hypothetical protein